MSIFYDADTSLQVKADESYSTGERTDFGENAGAAFKAFRRSEIFTSEGNNQEEEYINIIDILNTSGHADYISPLEVTTDPLSEDGDMSGVFKSRDELQKEFWQQVSVLQSTDENLRTKLTEAGLDNFENMQKTIASKTQNAWKDYTEINERATTAGWWGGMGGMAGAAFTDPIMLMTIPISFGYSVPAGFSAAALKVGLMEGIIGGVAETIIQLKAQPYRAELGFDDASLATGAKNVLMVTGASAVLSPLLLGAFKAFGKGVDVGKKFLTKQTPEDLQIIYKDMGEINPKIKDKDLTEFELPKKDSPFEDTASARVEHNERLDTTARAIENGEPVDLPPLRSTLETPEPTKIEFNDITTSNPAIKNTYDEITNIKNKVNIEQTVKTGEIETLKTEINRLEKVIEKPNKVKIKDFIVAEESLKNAKTRLRTLTEALKVAEVETVTKKFNQNPSKLADDQSNVKDFDVPNEAAYRNQASDLEGSMFDVSTSSAIKTEAGTGAAAKTSPRVELDNFQDLSLASQKTDATPSSSVLATATTNPPLVRGSIINKVGDTSTISNKLIYQVSNDFNEIFNTLSKKLKNVKKELQPIAIKYNGDLKARVKKKPQLQKKLDDGLNAESISDYLGARISVKTIHEAEMVLNDLSKIYKFIERDNFLTDAGRVGSDYRAIHAQALTKDGFTFEIQIRLKELDPLTEQSHILFKLKKGGVKNTTMVGWNKLLNAEKVINKKLKAKYFEIKDKEFTRLKSEDPLDRKIPIGHRIDEVTGEKVPLTITAREALEQAAKDETMLSRLKDCV